MVTGVEILTTEAVRLARIFEDAQSKLQESHAHVAEQQYEPVGHSLQTLLQNHQITKNNILTHVQEEIFQTHNNISEHSFQKKMFQPQIPTNVEQNFEIGSIAQQTLQAITIANEAFIKKKQSERTVKEQLSITLNSILQ